MLQSWRWNPAISWDVVFKKSLLQNKIILHRKQCPSSWEEHCRQEPVEIWLASTLNFRTWDRCKSVSWTSYRFLIPHLSSSKTSSRNFVDWWPAWSALKFPFCSLEHLELIQVDKASTQEPILQKFFSKVLSSIITAMPSRYYGHVSDDKPSILSITTYSCITMIEYPSPQVLWW